MPIRVNHSPDIASLNLLTEKAGEGDYREHLKQLSVRDDENRNRARRAAKILPAVLPFPKTLGGIPYRHD